MCVFGGGIHVQNSLDFLHDDRDAAPASLLQLTEPRQSDTDLPAEASDLDVSGSRQLQQAAATTSPAQLQVSTFTVGAEAYRCSFVSSADGWQQQNELPLPQRHGDLSGSVSASSFGRDRMGRRTEPRTGGP